MKQSKNTNELFMTEDRPQWPHFLLSDSTLTCFAVIRDTQLAIIWGGALAKREEKDEISPPDPISSLSRGPIEQ